MLDIYVQADKQKSHSASPARADDQVDDETNEDQERNRDDTDM